MSLEPQTLPVCLFPKQQPWISRSKLEPKLCLIYHLQYAICACSVTCPFTDLSLCVTPLIKSSLEPGRCSQWIDSLLPALWDTSLTQSSFLWKWALKPAPKYCMVKDEYLVQLWKEHSTSSAVPTGTASITVAAASLTPKPHWSVCSKGESLLLEVPVSSLSQSLHLWGLTEWSGGVLWCMRNSRKSWDCRTLTHLEKIHFW